LKTNKKLTIPGFFEKTIIKFLSSRTSAITQYY
jgi:hypothetical protein